MNDRTEEERYLLVLGVLASRNGFTLPELVAKVEELLGLTEEDVLLVFSEHKRRVEKDPTLVRIARSGDTYRIPVWPELELEEMFSLESRDPKEAT